MELFTKLFGSLLVFVYHCFDRIVIHGYLSALTRPEQVVYFFRQVVGVEAVDKEVLSRRTGEYQDWVEAFARNHDTPIEWAEKGVRKEDYVQRWLRSMVRARRYGVYFIFKSMEQGPTFRCTVPKYPTRDPNHRILAPAAQPLHALLLLHSRRDLGAHRDARGLVLSVPDHLLSQRPLIHRAGTAIAPGSAFARTTTPFWRSTIRLPCRRQPTGSAPRSSASGWTTGRCCWGRSSRPRSARASACTASTPSARSSTAATSSSSATSRSTRSSSAAAS